MRLLFGIVLGACLTIGGAYAVLPYVYESGVNHFQWLTGPQMIDGLALGETTPGPLIMIVTWVGYLGGVAKEVFPNPIAAGLAGATVATSGAESATAAALVSRSIIGVDTPGAVNNPTYVLTLTVTAGSAASTVSAVGLIALVA